MALTGMRRFFNTCFFALAAVGVAAAPMPTAAQNAPDIKRLEIVIPYSAGGGTDRFSRSLVEDLKARMDATIAVRNVPGDAAMLGLSRIARAASDDAMLAFHNPPNTVLAQLARGKDAPVDIRKLTPIAGYSQTFSVLAVNTKSEYKTFKDLVAAYKSGKERLFGGTDRGGSAEIAATLIRDQWDAKWAEYVAYDGSGDLNAALARQEVPAGIGSYDAVLSGKEGGVLRPLVVLGAQKRQSGMPDTPTAVELGLPSLAEVAAPSRIIVGPPNMDAKNRDYFVKLWKDILTDSAVVERFAAQKRKIEYVPPDAIGALINDSFAKLENLPALKAVLGKK